MASGPITLWQIDGETMETVTDFIFLGSKITAEGDCNHEIKRHLLLGRKAMTNLDSILKSRYITLLTKVYRVKGMVFPVVMYGCESWTIKKVEHWITNAFELWCWRKLLRVPWTAKRSNQSILKEISPEYSLEGLMLRLKLQYFGHWMQRVNSLVKILKLGKIEGKRRRRRQSMKCLTSITDLIDTNLSKLWETVEEGGVWCAVVHAVAKSQMQLSDWTTYRFWNYWWLKEWPLPLFAFLDFLTPEKDIGVRKTMALLPELLLLAVFCAVSTVGKPPYFSEHQFSSL